MLSITPSAQAIGLRHFDSVSVLINSVDELIPRRTALQLKPTLLALFFLPPHMGHAVLFQTQAVHTDWTLKT
ncbi:hypothetical protein [Pseudomonas sp.]|uniref:hypothetical protein n=1 Tax=Pseudomonas sp. TaxID=306 RepID=UPI00262B2F4A|nr:hypothetical protein [Pseudomonas sp.]